MNNLSFSQDLATSLYESKNSHPVNFDDAWKWLGYSTKQKAKDKLTGNFEKGEDYLTEWLNVPHSNGLTASRTEIITLTVDCFKSLGMMAGTSQGKSIRKYFLECEKIAKTKIEPKKAIAHYSDRVADIRKHLSKPQGYWCVIEKCNHLLLEVENAGYAINQFDLLDGSVGSRWSAYRKEIGLDNPVKEASYLMPRRMKRPAMINAYPSKELGIFSDWLETIYEPRYLSGYLKEKYGKLAKVSG